MTFTREPISEVLVHELVRFVDERGFLLETFRMDVLPQDLRPVMSYVSYTEPGVTRGPHEHACQTDVFAFVGPANFKVVLWDNRKQSATYGHKMALFAGQDSPRLLVVPPGVVHAYQNVSRTQSGMVINYPDRLYGGWHKKEGVDEIRHEDQQDVFYLDFG